MRHILFISHARGAHGAETVMVQAIRACLARGARVTLVVPSIVPDEGMEKALSDCYGVEILALPYRAGGQDALRTLFVQLYNLRTIRSLKRYIQREHVDVIYSNTIWTIIGASLAKKTGVRHVWHWHEPADALYGWNETLEETYLPLIKHTDAIICISHQQQAQWEQTLTVSLPQAQVIYNPIKPISPISSNKYAFHRGARIGFIGHFEARKNLDMLLRVFEWIHEQEKETQLLLCGALNESDQWYIEQLTELRAPVVEVLPHTSEVAKFYNSIDILVLPSWSETMPLVVLEALQAGVCVLQTNRSGMNELIEDGKESLFFSPDDADTLYQLLMQCMNPDFRQTIAQAGQRKVQQLIKDSSFDTQITKLLCE